MEIARHVFDWARRNMPDFWYGKGSSVGSCFPRMAVPGSRLLLFAMWTNGTIEMQFQHMRIAPFGDEDARRELMRRLNAIPGISIPDEAVTRRPSFDMRVLAGQQERASFLGAMQWAIDQVKA